MPCRIQDYYYNCNHKMILKKRYAALLSCFFITALYAGDKNTVAGISDTSHDKFILCLIFLFLTIGILAFVIRIIIRHSIRKQVAEEKQKLVLDNKLLETELRVNRSLMNPH